MLRRLTSPLRGHMGRCNGIDKRIAIFAINDVVTKHLDCANPNLSIPADLSLVTYDYQTSPEA